MHEELFSSIRTFLAGKKTARNAGSTITSLKKDTITLEVSVDDRLGMQVTEKEHDRLGALDVIPLINSSKFIVLLKQILQIFKLHTFGMKASVPTSVPATLTGENKNKIKLRFPA